MPIMPTKNNQIIFSILEPIVGPSYLLRLTDSFSVVFSFAGLESIARFYRSIRLNKAASNIRTNAINSLFTTPAITEKDTAVEKKLLVKRFANNFFSTAVSFSVIAGVVKSEFIALVRIFEAALLSRIER